MRERRAVVAPKQYIQEQVAVVLFTAPERVLWMLSTNNVRDGFGGVDGGDMIYNKLIKKGAILERNGQKTVAMWAARLVMEVMDKRIGDTKDSMGRPRMRGKK